MYRINGCPGVDSYEWLTGDYTHIQRPNLRDTTLLTPKNAGQN